MTNRIRIIRHEAVPQSGSFEVRFSDGSRGLRPETLTQEQALEQAEAPARAERERLAFSSAPKNAPKSAFWRF